MARAVALRCLKDEDGNLEEEICGIGAPRPADRSCKRIPDRTGAFPEVPKNTKLTSATKGTLPRDATKTVDTDHLFY